MPSEIKARAVVIIGGEGDPFAAESTLLVAALLALGVPANTRCPFVETLELDGEQTRAWHRWILSDRSTCGKYHTAALRKLWVDPQWLGANAGHPLAQIRGAFHLAGECVLAPELLDALPIGWLARATPSVSPNAATDALRVLELVREQLENSVPLMIVRKGKRSVYIPIDATPDEEAFLLSKLDKK